MIRDGASSMTGWVRKRFWTEVSVAEAEGGFAILLDGRGVKTPAKSPLVVPTIAFAEIIARRSGARRPRPSIPPACPATRASNAAIDKVRGQMDEVAGLISDYGDSDQVLLPGRCA